MSAALTLVILMITFKVANEAGSNFSRTHFKIVLTTEVISWISIFVFAFVVTNICFLITTMSENENE